MKIVEHCDSIISEIYILTVALFWSARQSKDSGNSIISKIPILTAASHNYS